MAGPADLRVALTKDPTQFAQTVTEKLMTYALGRRLEYFDMPVVRKIVRDSARNQYRFSSIVMGIVQSAPFQMRQVESVENSNGAKAAPAGVAELTKPATPRVN